MNVIKDIQNCLKVGGRSFIAVATSDVAVKFIKMVRTAHYALYIPISGGAEDTCHMSADSNGAQKLRRCVKGLG